jgi:hypothetical protein
VVEEVDGPRLLRQETANERALPSLPGAEQQAGAGGGQGEGPMDHAAGMYAILAMQCRGAGLRGCPGSADMRASAR